MTGVRLEHITKTFTDTAALRDISLAIEPGELFFLLGPSGCGKSTLLRLIAGLHQPTTGRIFFNDRDVTDLPTEKRNAVMCFQSYALWPHMTVRENVRFGLKVRGLPRDEQDRRIEEALNLVQIADKADRKPNELSGGQQQRVALARSLVVRPNCLLLDEPLSNLDAKLRHEMRTEIRRICKTAGFTTIYVTHDQKEALAVADRIAVMNLGRVEQVGAPADLYHRPATPFVAGFVGQTNLLRGTVVGRDGVMTKVRTDAGDLLGVAPAANGSPTLGSAEADQGKRVTLSIRPEMIRFAPVDGADAPRPRRGRNRLPARPVSDTFLGEQSEHVLAANGMQIKVVASPPIFTVPPETTLEFDPHDAVVLPE